MPIVAMPDGAQVSFPDDMPDDQIRALIVQKFPEIGQQPQKDRSLAAGIQDIWNNPQDLGGRFGNLSLIGSLKSAYQGLRGPGDALQGKFTQQPQTPGVWTEEDQFLADLKQKQLREAAAGAATLAPTGNIPMTALRTRPPPVREIAADAAKDYAKYRATGAEFSPEISTALGDAATAQLKSKGSYPHLEGQGQVFNTVDLLKRETPLPADEFRSVLEALSGLKNHSDPGVRRAAGIASDELTNFLSRTEPEAAANLQRANQGYAVAKRAQQINNVEDVAQLRTGRAGYGGNAVNAVRQVLSPIVEKAIKGNKQGFNEAEIQAMREIVEGTPATNLLRGVGQLSPSKGAIQTLGAIGTMGVTGAIGAISNKLATILTGKQIERLNELVRKRSPAYEEAVGKSAGKFFGAADQFVIEPNPQNFAKSISAARAFANGLNRDGIPVSSGELLRYLSSPQKSAAEQEQVPGEPGQ